MKNWAFSLLRDRGGQQRWGSWRKQVKQSHSLQRWYHVPTEHSQGPQDRKEAGHCPNTGPPNHNQLCFLGRAHASHMVTVMVMTTCLRGCKDSRKAQCFESHCFKTHNQTAKKNPKQINKKKQLQVNHKEFKCKSKFKDYPSVFSLPNVPLLTGSPF